MCWIFYPLRQFRWKWYSSVIRPNCTIQIPYHLHVRIRVHISCLTVHLILVKQNWTMPRKRFLYDVVMVFFDKIRTIWIVTPWGCTKCLWHLHSNQNAMLLNAWVLRRLCWISLSRTPTFPRIWVFSAKLEIQIKHQVAKYHKNQFIEQF